jgi:hypothetical protein
VEILFLILLLPNVCGKIKKDCNAKPDLRRYDEWARHNINDTDLTKFNVNDDF